MAEIIAPAKPLAVNPLKVSQPMGAALAFLGLAGTLPLEHGAQGCTAFSKVFFTRHFREPVPSQTTAMDQVAAIIGGDANIVTALCTIARCNGPAIVGLLTTGLSETHGVDIQRALKEFRAAHPEFAEMAVVPVNTPDTRGSLETGFALAVEAIIATLVPSAGTAARRPKQVNLLPSPMLTPGDVEALKDWIEAFGLTPVVLPDLADSLDGHLLADGFVPLTFGGTGRAAIATMGSSAATFVVGPSLNRAADLLRERTGVPDRRFAGLMDLESCDALIECLATVSGRPVPPRIERQRAQLLDAMVDGHFQLGAARVAVAADPDLLGMLTRFLAGLGAEVTVAVASSRAESLAALPVAEVVVGDLEEVETRVRWLRENGGGADLLIGNSHAAETAARLGVPLLRAGFPLYDIMGGAARQWVGYRGMRQTLFDIANMVSAGREGIPPYRSRYWAGTARALETAP